jgi:hypothetical protein
MLLSAPKSESARFLAAGAQVCPAIDECSSLEISKDEPDQSVENAEEANIIARLSMGDSIVPDAMPCGNPFATILSF